MEPVITSIHARDFAQKTIDLLRKKEPEPPEPPKPPLPKQEVQGPDRTIGITDYKKWETFQDEDEEATKKQAEEYAKTMCSQDHRKEIELFERPTREKLDAASTFKQQGNDSFKQGNFSLAALFYRKGILQLDYTFPDTKQEEEEFKQTELSLHLNMCIAKYHLEEYDEALTHSAQALRIHPNHPKALFRKAQVMFARDLYDEAETILGSLDESSSQLKEVIQLKKKLAKKRDNYKDKQKVIYKAMFKE